MRLDKLILILCCLVFSLITKGQTIYFTDVNAIKQFDKEIFSGNKLTLLVFLSPECPLSKNYSVVLQKIADDFEQAVNVVGIIPGSTVSKKEMQAFTAKYKLSFPLLIDKKMVTVKAVSATITPEVVLMDSHGTQLYRGAIDDWAVDLGKKKNKASNEYLRLAIEQTISGMPVSTKMVQPVGCLINNF